MHTYCRMTVWRRPRSLPFMYMILTEDTLLH